MVDAVMKMDFCFQMRSYGSVVGIILFCQSDTTREYQSTILTQGPPPHVIISEDANKLFWKFAAETVPISTSRYNPRLKSDECW
jgi:hypothetical protein